MGVQDRVSLGRDVRRGVSADSRRRAGVRVPRTAHGRYRASGGRRRAGLRGGPTRCLVRSRRLRAGALLDRGGAVALHVAGVSRLSRHPDWHGGARGPHDDDAVPLSPPHGVAARGPTAGGVGQSRAAAGLFLGPGVSVVSARPRHGSAPGARSSGGSERCPRSQRLDRGDEWIARRCVARRGALAAIERRRAARDDPPGRRADAGGGGDTDGGGGLRVRYLAASDCRPPAARPYRHRPAEHLRG